MAAVEKGKKVSRACNTCRVKRKKCDGLFPCFFCTETKIECSYSREPRRRGPPSGYLRYTETRVALLETLLGCIVLSAPSTLDALHNSVATLTSQSTTCTQDVWDAYKKAWTVSDAARSLSALAAIFAPFAQAESTPDKPLLPLAGVSPPKQRPPSPELPPSPTQPSYINESFERGVLPQTSAPSKSQSSAYLVEPTSPSYLDVEAAYTPYPTSTTYPDAQDAYPGAYWRTAALESASSSPSPSLRNLTLPAHAGGPATDLPPPHIFSSLLRTYRTHVHPYFPILDPRCFPANDTTIATGIPPMLLLALCAYTARLGPPTPTPSTSNSTSNAKANRVAADLWYEQAVGLLGTALRHSSSASAGFAAIDSNSTISANDQRRQDPIHIMQTLLLLALRDLGRGRSAQAWRAVGLAVRISGEVPGIGVAGTGMETGQQMKQSEEIFRRGLWGALHALDTLLAIQLGRQPACADTLKTPLLLSTTTPQLSLISNERTTVLGGGSREGIAVPREEMGVGEARDSLVLILARVHYYLYLGFGVVPASDTAATSPATSSQGLASAASTRDTLHATRLALAAELRAWHVALPPALRVALGGAPPVRGVLEVQMMFQVGGVLVWGTGDADGARHPDATEALLDAAATFNILLDKYRASAPSPSDGDAGDAGDALAYASPHMIYLIFTVAMSHLSSVRRPSTSTSTSTTNAFANSGASTSAYTQTQTPARALQTQLHLLTCLEALGAMGGTWEIARRCARQLGRAMEAAGVGGGAELPFAIGSPGGRGLSMTPNGKRKRGLDVQGQPDGKRQALDDREAADDNVAAAADGMLGLMGWNNNQGIAPLQSEFDFDAWTFHGPGLDFSGMGAGEGETGMWEGEWEWDGVLGRAGKDGGGAGQIQNPFDFAVGGTPSGKMFDETLALP